MSSQKMTTHADEMELEAWRQAMFLVVSLAVLVFLVQRFFGPIFEIAFEIFIFYVPAITITLLYLYFKARLTFKEQS